MGKEKAKRHRPLAEDILQPYAVTKAARRKERESRRKEDTEEVRAACEVKQHLLPSGVHPSAGPYTVLAV